jgi:hypothetical protein
MEMRITITGVGFALGKTGFGANLVSGAYVETRINPSASPCIYGLTKGPSLGSNSGSIIFGHVQTAWFRINDQDVKTFSSPGAIVGKIADVKITGAIIAGGHVDVSMDVIDKDGNIATLVSKANIRSSGMQAASTKGRGVLKQMPAPGCVPTLHQ